MATPAGAEAARTRSASSLLCVASSSFLFSLLPCEEDLGQFAPSAFTSPAGRLCTTPDGWAQESWEGVTPTRGNATRLELASPPGRPFSQPRHLTLAGARRRTGRNPRAYPMSCAAPSCQEPPPPPAFAGGPVCAPPWAAHSTSAAAKVAPETWLDSVWAAAAGLLDDDDDDEPPEGAAAAAAAAAGDQSCSLDFPPRDDAGPGDQLSVQLYRNKQLQDTLLQKEEELARLQEENNHLRLFLNSTLVKQLEEKTKKLLWQESRKPREASESGKRRLRADRPPLPREASHPQKARRNLLGAFSACPEEQPGPHVDGWVLQTLGLKDIDTIDESPSANHNALALDPEPSSFFHGPAGPTDLGAKESQPAAYRRGALPPVDSAAADARNEPLPPSPQLPSVPRSPPACLAPCALPCCSEDPPPAPMALAFTASLSPHCNVKTHTFRQGQAFVRREEDGGWKLTWVPKQPE